MAAQPISLWARMPIERRFEILKKNIPERILNIFRECIIVLYEKTDLTAEEITMLFTPLFREKNLPEIEDQRICELRQSLTQQSDHALSEHKNLLLGRFGWRIIQLKILIKELPLERKKLLSYYFCLILRTFAT